LRFNGQKFEYFNFNGTRWQNINKEDNILYLKNAYRVLLTRARQGFIIFVPEGDSNDATRKPEYYDGIFEYLKAIGIKEFEA
jgi:superfamily I DNA and/or RNA helicase